MTGWFMFFILAKTTSSSTPLKPTRWETRKGNTHPSLWASSLVFPWSSLATVQELEVIHARRRDGSTAAGVSSLVFVHLTGRKKSKSQGQTVGWTSRYRRLSPSLLFLAFLLNSLGWTTAS